ncbi:MAG: TonB-dependent receptor plug domain-containing protein [Desulfobacterales bacterium]|nr:TonB-dependent receptor plug domain-containing protein [Desulfobacterales bacterium]
MKHIFLKFIFIIYFLIINFMELNLLVADTIEDELGFYELEKKFMGATLTKTKRRSIPAAVLTISKEQIETSGARSLNELLEIYVPGLQWINHSGNVSHVGLRGIISDRDDKYMLLINGRVMNQHTCVGQFTERDQSLLSEIHHIDVIRGPGSAIMGLGAVSMVINIITFDAEKFDGFESKTRVGYNEEFYTQELKYTYKFSDEIGLFLYGGLSKYIGADSSDAPYKFDKSFTSRWGDYVEAGEGVPGVNRDRTQYRDKEPYKLHAHLNANNLAIWARFVRGGETMPLNFNNIANEASGGAANIIFDPNKPYQSWNCGYQQSTITSQYKHLVTETLKAEHTFSYDMTNYERDIAVIGDVPSINLKPMIQSHREDEYFYKLLLNWEPEKTNQYLAFGFEISHEEFGLKSPGYPDKPPISSGYRGPDNQFDATLPRWSTNTYSLLFEHQWNFLSDWNSFIGARIDKNTYSDYLLSPRLALIYEATAKDTLKFIYCISQRINFAAELRDRYEKYGVDDSDPEKLDSIEIRWERCSKPFSVEFSTFYFELEAIGFDPLQRKSVVNGRQKQWGIETELRYQTYSLDLCLSHAYTQLSNYEMLASQSNLITTGDDLNNWSNHITKLVVIYKLINNLTINSSFQYYWGFDGLKDYMNANNFTVDKIGESNAYLHLSLVYNFMENFKIQISGHYLLGLLDEDLNKRNYFADTSGASYRDQAPAVSFSLSYQF